MNFKFLRTVPVNLLRYLPKELAKDIVFKNTLDICSEQHEKMRLKLMDIARQFFVSTATWGLDDWERVLAIKPQGNIKQRRKRILLKLQSNTTSTVGYMETLAKRYFAENAKVCIEEDNENYVFRLLGDSVSYDMNGLLEAIETYKPAHLAFLLVHYFESLNSIYQGAVIQEAKTIIIEPTNEFSIDIGNTKMNVGGIIQKCGTIKIK